MTLFSAEQPQTHWRSSTSKPRTTTCKPPATSSISGCPSRTAQQQLNSTARAPLFSPCSPPASPRRAFALPPSSSPDDPSSTEPEPMPPQPRTQSLQSLSSALTALMPMPWCVYTWFPMVVDDNWPSRTTGSRYAKIIKTYPLTSLFSLMSSTLPPQRPAA